MANVSRLVPLVTLIVFLLPLIPSAGSAIASPLAQAATSQQQSDEPGSEQAEADEGIPITSELVRESCGSCHESDDQNRMSRISYQRTTPEGWQQTTRRMVLLNGLAIEAEAAREVVRYLSNHQGLAPEEARPAAFEIERRRIDYKYRDEDTEETCTKCHSMGRVIIQRRTKAEWELLIAMHRGFYPLVDFQAFRRSGPPEEPGPDGRPPDNRHPMDKAIAHLAAAFPLRTPEWAAWSANMRSPNLEGTWALSGHDPGKGPVYGRVVITATAADEFETEGTYAPARGGTSVTRRGRAIVYTGFQWRGRSFEGTGDTEGLREVMFVERDWRTMSGRWFTGGYDEIGLDVTLRRVGRDPVVLGVYPTAVKTGARGQELRIYGANLPPALSPGDIDFGPGVEVTRVVSATSEVASVEVDVAAAATVAARDVFVGRAAGENALVVYDKVDAIKVTPQAGLARVGGVVFPKQYQQFEAEAYHHGPDGKPDTGDDVHLGRVNVTWSLEEYSATFGDDDLRFVGSIDAEGLFTPADDGPNPARRNNANNVGDVWVVATYTPEGEARSLRARAQLVVSVPLYTRRPPLEVER